MLLDQRLRAIRDSGRSEGMQFTTGKAAVLSSRSVMEGEKLKVKGGKVKGEKARGNAA